MDSSWRRPRVVAFVLALDVLVLVGGVWSLARYRAGHPLNPIQAAFGRESTAEGRRELRLLRGDPVLDFRAPGTRLRSVHEAPAGKDLWSAHQPTEIRQLFSLDGEPGEVVERYRKVAEAAGWRWVESRCQFDLRSSSVLLAREVDGVASSLRVYAHLARPPPDAPRPGLVVELTAEPPGRPPQPPATADRRWRDPHCLRSFDPSSPALLEPVRVPSDPVAICGLLSAPEAARVVGPTGAQPGTNASPGCRYDGPGHGRRFLVVGAPESRAYYEDRRHEPAGAPVRAWFLLDDDQQGTATGAWADTRIGPVRVYADGLDPSQLEALAALLARP